MAERPIYPVNRLHLTALTGKFGIWQHASGPNPNVAFGYCTDDVARALVVDLLHAPELGWAAVRPSASRSLRFIGAAFDPVTGSFRNFRNADGSWIDEPGSEDCQGRALLALAAAIGVTEDPRFARDAGELFARALPVALRLRALRAVSSALIACDLALDTHTLGPRTRADVRISFKRLTATLTGAFASVNARSDWPWPEPVLTYENALLPRALLVAGRRLDDDNVRQTGRRVLDWLIRVQTTWDGMFSPIGSAAWWRRGDVRSRYDQQPIEATATILACDEAFAQSGDGAILEAIETAYAWFLGSNDLGMPVAITDSGGCHDGLTPLGVNLNQGAESTLMWLTALEHVRRIRRGVAAGPSPRDVADVASQVAMGGRP